MNSLRTDLVCDHRHFQQYYVDTSKYYYKLSRYRVNSVWSVMKTDANKSLSPCTSFIKSAITQADEKSQRYSLPCHSLTMEASDMKI